MDGVKWIKIVPNIFEDEKIMLLESLPSADGIIVIWFKLLCLAGKLNNGGVLSFDNGKAYTTKDLATLFRRKENKVQQALEAFEQYGMIEYIGDTIAIPNWGKHQNVEKLEEKKTYQKNYMREYREKQKQLTCKTNSKVYSKTNSKENVNFCKTNCKTNVSSLEEDIEEDIDIYINNITKEREKEKEKERERRTPYGVYNKVLLSSAEYADLLDDFSKATVNKYIDKVDKYCESSGKVYKNYNLVIRKWIAEDKADQKAHIDPGEIEKTIFKNM